MLGIGDEVEIKMNVAFAELCDEFTRAMIGVHTMTHEHFGIGMLYVCYNNVYNVVSK